MNKPSMRRQLWQDISPLITIISTAIIVGTSYGKLSTKIDALGDRVGRIERHEDANHYQSQEAQPPKPIGPPYEPSTNERPEEGVFLPAKGPDSRTYRKSDSRSDPPG